MVGVVSYLLQVVVLAGDTEAFLGVGSAFPLAGLVAEEDVLELVHAGVGEHKGRVVFHDDGCRWHYNVFLRAEKVEETVSDFLCVHEVFF